jgi:ankyrin repeat protein
MYDAAQQGKIAAMQLLVQHGADVHNTRGSPWSSVTAEVPLSGAASHGQLEAVRWLHDQGVTDAEVGEALVTAAEEGHGHVVWYLLRECGADVSLHGPDALRPALKHRRWEVVCLLLEAGNPTGGAAFLRAAQQCLGQISIERLGTILQASTQHGHAEFAEMLRGG